jgi:C4-dicarboxylate transporter
MGIGIALVVLVVVGFLVGAALSVSGLLFAVPLVLILIGAVIGKEAMERQNRIMRMKRFRRDARVQKVDFDTVDKRTLV